MEAWNPTRRTYGRAIPVGYAFKRIWEGGHGTTSQHYAGVAFDVGQRSSAAEPARPSTRPLFASGAWGYVEPTSMTPTWVHFDRRYGKPACAETTAGYPTLRRGSRSTYVLVLQDALNALGYDHRHAGRHLRPCDRKRTEGLPAAIRSAGRRNLRLRNMEKDCRCHGGYRPHGNRHRQIRMHCGSRG